MDLAPTLGVFTQPGTASIYNFLVVKVKKQHIKQSTGDDGVYKMEHGAVCRYCEDLERCKKKKVSLSITSHLSIFFFPAFLSHIPRVIPPHELYSDFSGSLPVNIRHNLTFAAVPNPFLLCLHTAH